MKKVTIRDVAEFAGVSPKTVSNVIHNRPSVSAETRKKVEEAIEVLGFRPGASAQAQRSRQERFLAAVIPDVENAFFTAVVRGIEDFAFEAGYQMLLCDTGDSAEREGELVRVMCKGAASGVILCAADEALFDQHVRLIKKAGMEVVAFDRAPEDAGVDTLFAENFEGSYTAVEHLIRAGHRRIGIIALPDTLTTGRERVAGYCKALEDAGLPVDERLIQRSDLRHVTPQDAARNLLNQDDPPTAIFVSNGPSACGTMEVLRASGLKIPKDMAVIQFDDSEWARMVDTPLTVIDQPAYEMGRMAAELLLKRLADPDAPLQKIRVPVNFIHRNSCCI